MSVATEEVWEISDIAEGAPAAGFLQGSLRGHAAADVESRGGEPVFPEANRLW